MARSLMLWWLVALGLGAIGLAVHASPVAFGAQDSGPVVVVPGTPWFDQPWFLGLCGALISMGIGALKKSPAGAWLDKSALRDMAAVLIASVLAALPHLASGWPAFGYAVLGHVIAATVAWAGASGVAKVSAERKAAGLDVEQK